MKKLVIIGVTLLWTAVCLLAFFIGYQIYQDKAQQKQEQILQEQRNEQHFLNTSYAAIYSCLVLSNDLKVERQVYGEIINERNHKETLKEVQQAISGISAVPEYENSINTIKKDLSKAMNDYLSQVLSGDIYPHNETLFYDLLVELESIRLEFK